MAQSNTSNDSPIIGCIFLLAMVIVGGIFVYKYFFPSTTRPAETSLSAFFVDDSGNPLVNKESVGGKLKIKGQAYQAGKPLTAGTVEVTVNTLDDSFRQSISVELKSGQFETDDQAFRSLSPDDRLHITADVTGTDASNVFTGSKEIFLNTAAPTFTSFQTIILWVIVSLVLVAILWVFFTMFTGRRTADKNRYAIIFSYLFGGVFLAVPLLAPVLLLQVFPNVRRTMVGMPAGLVLTRVGTGEEAKNQWALNIGGFSKIPQPADATAEAPAVPAATATPTPPRQGSPTTTPRATPTTTPTPAPDAAVAGASPATQTPSPTASPTRQPNESPRPSPTQRRINGQDTKGEVWDGIVEVEGGLLIPLYVIILSVIGGAINMTRKVPRFQGEGEYSETTTPSISPWSPIKKAAKSVAGKVSGMFKKVTTQSPETAAELQASAETPAPPPAPKVPEPQKPAVTTQPQAQPADDQQRDPDVSLDVQAKQIDDQINGLVKGQLARSSQTREALVRIDRLLQDMQKLFEQRTEDERRVLGFDSFDEWLSSRVAVKEVLGRNWRVELLNQYMYLISAPFLAIVAYYILDLLGLNKQAVLVVISFSVGLISERILNWILGIAGNYLRGSKTQAGAS